MLEFNYLPSFAKDRKRCLKKHWDEKLLAAALMAVINSDTSPIPFNFNDHALKGDKQGYRLLHIGGRSSNWLLLYKQVGNEVVFVRTGSHDELL